MDEIPQGPANWQAVHTASSGILVAAAGFREIPADDGPQAQMSLLCPIARGNCPGP